MKSLRHLRSILFTILVLLIMLASTVSAQSPSENNLTLLKDINPGSASSDPRDFVRVNGKVVFTADDGEHGRELWSTDGTPEGTKLIADINPGLPDGTMIGSNPSGTPGITGPGILNNILYFSGTNPEQGAELWRTDGTPEGSWLVKDINPGPGNAYPGNFMRVNGELFFIANNGVVGSELWKTDGTADGTVLVKDTIPGAYGLETTNIIMASLEDKLVFVVNGNYDFTMWRSDGSEAGTVPFFGPFAYSGDRETSDSVRFMLAQNGQIYVNLNMADYHGDTLWVTDGSTGGTKKITFAWRADGLMPYFPRFLNFVGDTLYFVASDRDLNDITRGYGIWKLPRGSLVAEEVIGPLDYGPFWLTQLNSKQMVYWLYEPDTTKYSEWVTDGTLTGTQKICPDCFGNLGDYLRTPFNGKVYFGADTNLPGTPGDSTNIKAWVTDGTRTGTNVFSDVNPGGFSSYGTQFYALGNQLYIRGNDGTHGSEPWVYQTALNAHVYLPSVVRSAP